jgi:hypothetical protein
VGPAAQLVRLPQSDERAVVNSFVVTHISTP